MFIISAGMPKSGSGYIYNLLNEMLILSGYKDAREIKAKHRLEKQMRWYNNNIGALFPPVLFKLLLVSNKEGLFVVKTHGHSTVFHKVFLRLGWLKTIYIYRDPRDVLLSAQESGKRLSKSGKKDHPFKNCIEFESCIQEVAKWIKACKSYLNTKGVLIIRYEDLIDHPKTTLSRAADYLKINVSKEILSQTIDQYDIKKKKGNIKGLHLNKALIGRHTEEFSTDQMEEIKKKIGDDIERIGYSW